MLASAVAMTLLLIVGIGLFANTARKRWALMQAAQAPADRLTDAGRRAANVLWYMFGQARMFRYTAAGIAHAFIFGGFVVLGLRTLVLMARGYTTDPHFGFWIFDDDAPLGMAYLFLKDIIGLLVLLGVAYFLYQRLVARPGRLELSTEGVFILCMISGLILSDLFYEAGQYIRESEGALTFHAVTPAASTVSFLLAGAPPSAGLALGAIGFWMHTIIVLTFLNFLPLGKHFHVITVLPNVYASDTARVGLLRGIQEIEEKLEREETLGVRTVQDMSWKDVLDLYTCTECGRCSDHCPATNTGKLLSPKHLTMALRDHMYAHEDHLIKLPRKPSTSTAEEASTTEDSGVYTLKEDEKYQLSPGIVDPEVIWACTSCGACEQECPVFISYVDKIIGLRQHAVMEQGTFPDQLQNAFRGLETVGNPYSFANEQRAEWAEGLDVPLRSDKPDAEYLYWVGCSPSFDDRARKIARATAQLLKAAGVDFAILGPEETCNGDPARRAGNEYLFQMLAQQNVETLNGYNVRKIVTTCPHCFNTLLREYPEFGGQFEVIHHTDFLYDLVKAGRLKPQHEVPGRIVYHDSCYIGRYHGIYDPPREILRAIPGLEVVEAKESRSRGMCCGAGGAQMWKEEEPIRREGSREGDGKVNHARTRQLLRVLPNGAPNRRIATACPFCKTMIGDGVTDQGEEAVDRRDVAEYLLLAVQGTAERATQAESST